MSSTNLLELFGSNSIQRVQRALNDLKKGKGILVVDSEDRENEGDLIFAAQNISPEQMAFMIRECSGIVCLCITEQRARELELPLMVQNNTSAHTTAFTISIDAKDNVTTGVSAKDRCQAIKVVVDDNSKPSDLVHPGHMFPLIAKENGVLQREGHTEAAVDFARLAGFKPMGVICELCAPDGDMARLPRVCAFAQLHDMCVVSIDDLIEYRKINNI